ncbi:hypothetical protein MRBBS_3559 [Marinobacter sp. BSs20148]|nr:hypothetical protein MRBBS_3559 [Marinobacter sp. BSs20148]
MQFTCQHYKSMIFFMSLKLGFLDCKKNRQIPGETPNIL